MDYSNVNGGQRLAAIVPQHSRNDPFKIQRSNELTAQLISLLQQRYSQDPPIWVRRAVDQLLVQSELFSALAEEVSS